MRTRINFVSLMLEMEHKRVKKHTKKMQRAKEKGTRRKKDRTRKYIRSGRDVFFCDGRRQKR